MSAAHAAQALFFGLRTAQQQQRLQQRAGGRREHATKRTLTPGSKDDIDSRCAIGDALDGIDTGGSGGCSILRATTAAGLCIVLQKTSKKLWPSRRLESSSAAHALDKKRGGGCGIPPVEAPRIVQPPAAANRDSALECAAGQSVAAMSRAQPRSSRAGATQPSASALSGPVAASCSRGSTACLNTEAAAGERWSTAGIGGGG